MRRSFRRVHAVAICAVAICLAAAALPIPAAARDWDIRNFHADVAVGKDGSAVVIEEITVSFQGVFHGIYRTIPINYPGPGGSNYRLFLNVQAVTDGAGNALKYESSRDGDFRRLKIYVPGAVDAVRTVIIQYRVANAVRFFDTHDEFYWNVTGNDWPVPIEHASASISLPQATAGSLEAQAFTGVYGSKLQDASTDIEGSHVSFQTQNPLPRRGGLTVDIYIPSGILDQPGPLTRAWWFLRANLILFLPLWTFLVMGALWRWRGRDPDPGMSVAPMYEPPAKMTPAEAGTLLDDRIDPRDITSTLVDLAVRGYIKIEEIEEPGLFSHKAEYVFHRIKPENEWDALEPYERVILRQVFAGGDETKLSWLKNRFYTAIPVVKHDIYAALKRKGMYWLDPESASGYFFLGVGISAAPLILGKWLDLFVAPLMAVIAVAVSVVIAILFGRIMASKTLLGVRTWVQVRGFEEFIDRVDSDRLRRMPSDTFEKFLPFAMAFGLEQQWAKKFVGILQQPPTWYAGPGGPYVGGFNPLLFSNRMHMMASSAHQAFVAAPRSSSSGSGFGGGGFSSGGGFSGGGFGGGGGGAF